jgi:hypothetical protein
METIELTTLITSALGLMTLLTIVWGMARRGLLPR